MPRSERAYRASRRYKRAGFALPVLTVLLLPFYALLDRQLTGTPESIGQEILYILCRMPAAEVALLAAAVVLFQRAHRRGLKRAAAVLAFDAGLLALVLFIHTALWFLRRG